MSGITSSTAMSGITPSTFKLRLRHPKTEPIACLLAGKKGDPDVIYCSTGRNGFGFVMTDEGSNVRQNSQRINRTRDVEAGTRGVHATGT